MFSDENDDTRIYRVVRNHEEQYSLWPSHKEVPAGWLAEGTEGSREECQAYIEHAWTDMCPLSLRKMMVKSSQTDSPASTTPTQ